ncbi:monosaccharide ABC transporter ATP-binding protein (CUT2 family) [Litoreibacter meonggei]|uniref:Monosaccharide ABC transporter ATP-binding protein (CUT2 family) n=1 Tax=Litoreibacter meonggei TaxID=1049199 RepID=A0A497VK12_9RHOB|nr:sugar ABC transporter ATP-binding protein [Litoreibacter meonggei]RLJ40998.1 monosaccharide ABC transporter ATP-binding protein (CUT2 family) [Litoreibacter meonggei]
MTEPLALSLTKICRSFGPVQVLHDVDITLAAGEVHALIGENGAGKSTTMKIMSGYLAPTSGVVALNDAPVSFVNSQDAEAQGVVLIHQEFNLAEQLSVEQNIFLGHEKKRGFLLDKAAMQAEARALLARLNCQVDPSARVSDIANADKQMVEIAKALSRNARVLIMDEPTAVLTEREAEVLFDQVDRLKAEGVAILFTSHKLDEVKRISDQITILRDGHVVSQGPTSDYNEDQMAEAMVGRDVSSLYPERTVPVGSEAALEVKGLSVAGFAHDISFTLKKGEILGISGLIGSGRTETMEGLVGLRSTTGEVRLNGKVVHLKSPQQAQAAGVCYLTEDRKSRGLLLTKGMRENLTLQCLPDFTNVLIDQKSEDAALTKAIEDFDIRAPSRDVAVGNLSGGNQQKLLIAKVMLADPDIVIIDEPTRGIDIGTKQQIYEFIHALSGQGKSIIVISSEMQEVIGLADRVLVMRMGRIAGEVSGDDLTEDKIVRLAMGLDAHKEEAA